MTTNTSYAQHAPEGTSEEAWNACLLKAKEDGISDPEAHCKTKFEEELAVESATLEEIAKELKLSDWDKGKVIAKVKELQELSIKGSSFEEEAKTKIANLERDNRIFHFSESTSKLDTVPGTTKELATKLANLEAKAGSEYSTEMLESWQAQQKSADEAKVTTTLLTSDGTLEDGEFSEVVNKTKEANKELTTAEAIKSSMRSNPDKYLARE